MEYGIYHKHLKKEHKKKLHVQHDLTPSMCLYPQVQVLRTEWYMQDEHHDLMIVKHATCLVDTEWDISTIDVSYPTVLVSKTYEMQ